MHKYPLYTDTDIIKQAYHSKECNVDKQSLNLLYGIKGEKTMNREYISVIVDEKPTVIFKRNIVAVSKDGGITDIVCVNDYHFLTREDYASVVKKIIG